MQHHNEQYKTGKSVFIVDDSLVIRERLAHRIGLLPGIETINQAKTIADADIILAHKPPDVLILDIQLPDGNGIDVLNKIKKTHATTIVIILTNYPYSIIRKRCIELGADYFFDKSTEMEKVFDLLDSLFRVTLMESGCI